MKETKMIRRRWINIRVNEEEYRRIEKLYKTTTCRALSEYTRNLLLNRPVTVKYRNTSLDIFLEEIIKLKNELNAIGNNFNQAVKKLHTLERIPEFRTWILINEVDKDKFIKKVDEIKEKLVNIYYSMADERSLQKGEKIPQK